MTGQRGRTGVFDSRDVRWALRIAPTACSNVAAIFSCMDAGSLPSTKYGVYP